MDKFDYYKIIGLNIAYYRKLRNLSQLQLAEMVNTSRTHLSNIEAPNSKVALSLELLLKIAEVLEIQPYKLLISIENVNPDTSTTGSQ